MLTQIQFASLRKIASRDPARNLHARRTSPSSLGQGLFLSADVFDWNGRFYIHQPLNTQPSVFKLSVLFFYDETDVIGEELDDDRLR